MPHRIPYLAFRGEAARLAFSGEAAKLALCTFNFTIEANCNEN